MSLRSGHARKVEHLNAALEDAGSYPQWLEIARELDRLDGLAEWREDDESDLYHYALLRQHVAELRAYRDEGNAVLLFEVVLNATALFNHANIDLPRPADRVLRLFVVTPDMHRVHHSSDPRETNSNYGFNLPWWDRLLGTYRAEPAKGHEGMEIGIEQFRTRRDLWLDRMLIQPLRGPPSGHALDPKGTTRDAQD